ncbi:MAG: hypothetical protein KA312_01640 [Sphingorhabdus sp.]|nr:hypothetical protein [Sphingorhabdus sp.]
MLDRYVVLGAALCLSACGQNNQREETVPPEQSGPAVSDAAPAGAAPAAPVPSAPTPPDQNAKRSKIDESLKGVWRETPYEIVNIAYSNERLSAVGETGTNYEATISVTLKFPSGWLASCAGPNAAWGCQHADSTMMQSSRDPIPEGESRSYSGLLRMGRLRRDGQWESKGGSWQQVEPEWEARVDWNQR